VFGQQPKGPIPASRAPSRHLLTSTGFGRGSLRALLGDAGVGLLEVACVDAVLGGLVVIRQRHNDIDDLDLSGESGSKPANTSFTAAPVRG
jgi:hypothetical protein